MQHVVRRNRIRQELYSKQQALEAWRQVTEVLLTGCPEDHLTPQDRQTVLLELLQELQQKVRGHKRVSVKLYSLKGQRTQWGYFQRSILYSVKGKGGNGVAVNNPY